MQKVQLQRGDTIAFYSDGLTEARNRKGKEFGLSGLAKCLVAAERRNASAVVDCCFQGVKSFSGGESQMDDMTVIAVRVVPPTVSKRRNAYEKNSHRGRR